MSSVNKCLGCGIPLQNENENEPGYFKNTDMKYCQRCFKLIHYGDTKNYIQRTYNKELSQIYHQYKDCLYILIVDCYETLILDKENFLDYFKEGKVILIVNKMDLLPKNVTNERIEEIYTKVFRKIHEKYPNVVDLLLTHYKDSYFLDSFFDIIKDYPQKKLLFAGKSNAGKSTIINRLLGNENLTVSIYPGTTVGALEMKKEDYLFIDTPGIDDDDNLLVHLPLKDLKKYLDYHTVKPLVYQIYEKQCYFLSKIFELDIDPKGQVSLIFEGLRDDIHRSNPINRERYLSKKNYDFTLLPWKRNEFLVKGSRTFLIKGFGLIRIKGDARVTFSINDKIKIYDSEVFI